MAELPDLGKHCKICNSLDYLPFPCHLCNEILCKIHKEPDAHQCPKRLTNSCQKPETTGKSILGKCQFCKNDVPDIELVNCQHCIQKHCLTHRHPDSHSCTSLKTESKVQKQIAPKEIPEAPKNRGSKNESLALRVTIMKLKQTAKGQTHIPQTERIYFKVTFKEAPEKAAITKAVYLSSNWSIGRCVDWLSSHFSLLNNNNKSSAPKLVLQNSASSIIYELSCKLQDLVDSSQLTNGDELNLLYQSELQHS